MKFDAGIEIRFLQVNVEESNCDGPCEEIQVYSDDVATVDELYQELQKVTQRFVKRRFRDLASGMFYCDAFPPKEVGE